ncbi:MAG: LysR family transcriptional regulator [Candidatus Latescibacteria bacterium]|nr:LysR family transcriptional regulator [Candidatus Latescibacterota bacterium]
MNIRGMNEIDLVKIDLNLLYVFDCIYREGSLTRAGVRLGRTQSAVSHALERLRALLGDPLFVRTSQGMRPTSRADELAPAIGQALQAVQRALRQPGPFDPSELTRTFRLAMSDYSEMIVLPPLMEALYNQAPGVQIDVLPTAAFQPQDALETGHIDLLVGNQDVGGGICQGELFVDEFVCLVSRDHPAISERIELEQYLQYPHVLFAPQGRGDRLLDQALKKRRVQRQVALRVSHIQSIPPVLGKTPYIVTMPAKFATALQRRDVRVLAAPVELPQLQVMQYWHEAVQHDQAHGWLRQLVHGLGLQL